MHESKQRGRGISKKQFPDYSKIQCRFPGGDKALLGSSGCVA